MTLRTASQAGRVGHHPGHDRAATHPHANGPSTAAASPPATASRARATPPDLLTDQRSNAALGGSSDVAVAPTARRGGGARGTAPWRQRARRGVADDPTHEPRADGRHPPWSWVLALALLSGCPADPLVATQGGSIAADASPQDADDDAAADSGLDAPDDTPPECITDVDCGGETGECSLSRCVAGRCEQSPTAGSPCDDGDPCTVGDTCADDGSCVGELLDCDDGNDCTDDSCGPGQGCANTPTPGLACDDGSLCTTGDVCSSAATCLGIPKVCGGGAGCLTGSCDDATGECDTVPDEGAECDDGDVCTVLDVCDGLGACTGSAMPCDDGVDCTFDACDPASGTCAFTVDEVVCDDGDPCTTPGCDVNLGCLATKIPGCCSADEGCYDGDDCTVDSCDLSTNLCGFTDNGACCGADGDCGSDEVCVSGDCFPQGDPVDYGFPRPAAWVSNLDLGSVEGAPPCCFDLDDDGEIDNAVGSLADSLSALIGQGGVNAALDDVILDGTVNLLFAFPSGTPTNLPDIPSLTVEAFQGDSVGAASYADKFAGEATFTAPTDNFLPGTSIAVGSFGQGSVAASVLGAGPGKLYEVPLQVLYFDFSQASLEQARIAGTLTPQGPGLSISDGQLGGVLPMISVWNAVNSFVDQQCGCLNLSAPLITPVDESSGQCSPAETSQVTCETTGTDYVCDTLNQFCNLALFLVTPDYDMDGNGIMDAMTVGIWFDASGTSIDGLTP